MFCPHVNAAAAVFIWVQVAAGAVRHFCIRAVLVQMQAAQYILVASHLPILPSACVQGAAFVLAGWRMLSFILQQDLHRRELNVANFLEDPRTGRKVC